jgi:hypothetical protein
MDAPPARVYRCRTRDDRWSFTVADGSAVIVGRTPGLADVVIPIVALARQDIRFVNEGGVLTVGCMGRRGSLWINGELFWGSASRPLLPGDEIMLLSGLVFVVEVADVQE